MTCSDFLARYSELMDGVTSPEERSALEAHLGSCPSCRRYDRVVTRGVSLFRTLPGERVRDDFRERLRHSLYSLDEDERRGRHRPHGPSGGGPMALAAVAALVAAILWTPVIWESTPTVRLPALVVDGPTVRPGSASPFAPPPALYDPPARPSPAVGEQDLWSGVNVLLFERSSLYDRHRDARLVRTRLD